MRKGIMLVAVAAVLVFVNVVIMQRETLLTHGKVVMLELTPVDPRSLMQGDYMALRFKAADDAYRSPAFRHRDGRLIVLVDGRGVGSFERFEDGRAPAPNEVPLHYRVRDDRIKLATNAYFFQEGHAQDYAHARYGEFRVDPDGEMILTGLRDADSRMLGSMLQ